VFDTKTRRKRTERAQMSDPKPEPEKDVLVELQEEFSLMRSSLEEILQLQRKILDKLEGKTAAAASSESSLDDPSGCLSVGILLSLPDHLRKTMIALSKLVEGRADEVATITLRARAIESGYLNQLVRLGYVKKVRKKHQIYFTVEGGG